MSYIPGLQNRPYTSNGQVLRSSAYGEKPDNRSPLTFSSRRTLSQIQQDAVALGIGAYITGDGFVGGTLTLNFVEGFGADSYQWMLDGVAISGEIGLTYTVQAGDLGKKITVRLTGIHATSNDITIGEPIPDEGETSPYQPLGIVPSTVIWLGASNSDGAISGHVTYLKRMFDTMGYPDVTMVDASVGGRHADAILADGWNPIKDTYTNDPNVFVILIDAPGNDITSRVNGYDGYAGTPEASLTEMQNNLQALYDAVVNNGNTCLLYETTFRNYTVNGVTAAEDESLGSLPFQVNLWYPIIENADTTQWNVSDDRPFASLYNMTYNNQETQTDGIHYNNEGNELNRRASLEMLKRWIEGSDPLVFEKLTYAEVQGGIAEPQSVLFGESNTTSTSPHTSIPFANYWRISADNTNATLVGIDGFKPSSVKITSTADVLSHGSNGSFTNDGDYSPTLNNYVIRQLYGYTLGTDLLDIFTISGLTPNSTVSVGIASFGDTTEHRVSEFTFNANETIQCDASNDSGSNIVYTDVVVDSNGEIAVTMQKLSGYTGHFNGCHIIV